MAAVTGVVLAFAAGAARTSSAPDRYTSASGGGFDGEVQQESGRPRTSEIKAREPIAAQYTSGEYRQLPRRQPHCPEPEPSPSVLGQRGGRRLVLDPQLELIDRCSWATRARARQAIFEFIEVFYNRPALHSSLGYLTPAEYEATKLHDQMAAQPGQAPRSLSWGPGQVSNPRVCSPGPAS